MTSPVTLHDVFDVELFSRRVAEGFIRTQNHPTEPLLVANYTDQATYDRVWDEATLACRGLVYVEDTLEVLARPLPKFFRWDEHSSDVVPALGALDGPISVMDKLDGSMGVIYREPSTGLIALNTRGSFTSDQARWATRHLRTVYPTFTPPEGVSLVFEIIYPTNRIVVDYGELEGLFLLAAVDMATGLSRPLHDCGWPGPIVDTFDFASITEVIDAPEVDGKEGFVVHFLDTDRRIKLKFAEYVRLHALLSNVSTRAVWKMLVADEDPVATMAEADAPDEVFEWVQNCTDELVAEHASMIADARRDHEEILAGLEDSFERKEYAMVAGRRKNRAFLFALLDGDEERVASIAWQLVEPEWRPFGRAASEETESHTD